MKRRILLTAIMALFSANAWAIPMGDCPELIEISDSKITDASLSKDLGEMGGTCEWFGTVEECNRPTPERSLEEKERLRKQNEEIELLDSIQARLTLWAQEENRACLYRVSGRANVVRYKRTGEKIEFVKPINLQGSAVLNEGAKNASLRINFDFNSITGAGGNMWDEFYVLRLRREDGGLDVRKAGPQKVEMTTYQYEANDFQLINPNTSKNDVSLYVHRLTKKYTNLKTDAYSYELSEALRWHYKTYGARTNGLFVNGKVMRVIEELRDEKGDLKLVRVAVEIPIAHSKWNHENSEYLGTDVYTGKCTLLGEPHKNYSESNTRAISLDVNTLRCDSIDYK